ncbi:MAG: P63C domain-containing protein [Pseudomonadota bacterium]
MKTTGKISLASSVTKHGVSVMRKGEEIFQATHRGILTIADAEVACAVLSNGKRVISQTSLFSAFDRPRKGEKRQDGLPSIIGASNLLQYVDDDLREKCKPVRYVHTNGTLAAGYDAELIPMICELYLKANDDDGVLVESQLRIVIRSTAIIRALAKVGITALIDEATGYQYDREKDELQRILQAYIQEDFLKWQARFPRKYYQEVFRLHKWEYDPQSLKRPQYLGKFTNQYVYKQMPQGVLDELRKKNPKDENGIRRHRHHQHLTPEIGIPHLDRHLTKLITVMELSSSIPEFKRNFQRVFNKVEQLQLTLDQDK